METSPYKRRNFFCAETRKPRGKRLIRI